MHLAYQHITTTGRLVKQMCRRFKCFFIGRIAKEEMFKTKWNKLMWRIHSLSKVKKDKAMQAFSKELFKIPTEVVQYARQ